MSGSELRDHENDFKIVYLLFWVSYFKTYVKNYGIFRKYKFKLSMF